MYTSEHAFTYGMSLTPTMQPEGAADPNEPKYLGDLEPVIYEVVLPYPIKVGESFSWLAVGNFLNTTDNQSREDQLNLGFDYIGDGVGARVTRIANQELKGLGKLSLTGKTDIGNGHNLYCVDLYAAIKQDPSIGAHLRNKLETRAFQTV